MTDPRVTVTHVDALVPGRWAHTRQPTEKELAATAVLVPLRAVVGTPIPDPDLPPGTPVPDHVAAWAPR